MIHEYKTSITQSSMNRRQLTLKQNKYKSHTPVHHFMPSDYFAMENSPSKVTQLKQHTFFNKFKPKSKCNFWYALLTEIKLQNFSSVPIS